MKTKNFFLCLVGVLVIFISACQKDFTPNDPAPNAVDSTMIGDSNYLSKILFNDTTFLSGGLDIDTSIFVFNYDNNKRLKNIELRDGPSSNASGNFFVFRVFL
jgi:hypothetical protein